MNRPIKQTLRNLRKNSTPAEKLFWNMVRNRKLCGCNFYRQHPIKCFVDNTTKTFIADFFCAEKRLVVEIDGAVHDRQRDYDELRSQVIRQHYLNVIRFTNDEIENEMERVISVVTGML